MKRFLKISLLTGAVLLPVILLFSCRADNLDPAGGTSGKTDPGRTDPAVDSTKSEFVLTISDFPLQVDVTLDGAALYTMTFSYDRFGRLARYCRKSSDNVLENAVITHKSLAEASVAYTRAGTEGASTLTVRMSSGHLVWAYPEVTNGNRYALLLDSGRWPSQYSYNVQFSGKKYSNSVAYKAAYTSSDGNVLTGTLASAATSTGSVATVCTTSADYEDKITYADKADRANLGAFVLADEFLPWYMKGLPGNKRLVSKIEHSNCGRKLSEYEEIKYEENGGKVSKMTVSCYSDGTLLHTKEYKISY